MEIGRILRLDILTDVFVARREIVFSVIRKSVIIVGLLRQPSIIYQVPGMIQYCTVSVK